MNIAWKVACLAVAASTLTFGGTAQAQAQEEELTHGPCELELTGDTSIEWRGLYGRGYEVTGQQQDFETLGITVRHQGAACEYFIIATPNSGGADNVLLGAGDQLYWDLLSQTSGPSIVTRDFFGSADTRLRGAFGPGVGGQSIMLFFTIPPSQFVRGGYYDGQLLLRLFRDDGGSPELVSELPVALIAPVASILQVRSAEFGPGVRETTIDLGDLTVPSTQSLNFEVISNATVGVTFVSRNNGFLAHEFSAPGVPYDLRLNGTQLSLDGSAQQRLDLATPGARSVAEVEIAVRPVPDGLAAGRYADSLTITFVADP